MPADVLHGRPILFVISGPSGSGKGTGLAIVASEFPDVKRATTYTTRQPRPGEADGIDYTFIAEVEFQEKVASGEIAEFTRPYRDYAYGSPADLVTTDDPRDVVVELDFRGMLRMRALSNRRVVSIFVIPPTAGALVDRIAQRHQEDNLDARLVSNAEQLETAWAYDYVVENRVLEDFRATVVTVVGAERMRRVGVSLLARLDQSLAQDAEPGVPSEA